MSSSYIDYGKSEYGQRLDFDNRKCRDPFCAVIYYLHIIGVIIAVGYIYGHDYVTIDIDDSVDWTGVYVTILVCAISGLLFGLIWLQIMRLFAAFIIKLLLFLNIVAWIILFIIGCIYVNWWMIIICGLLMIFWILYTWCVWSRVAFSTALLKVSCKIAGFYKGTICVAIVIVCIDLIWMFLWGSMLFGYVIIATEDNNNRVYGWVIFLMLISLYWTCCVNANLGHVAYSAVAGSWYFSNDPDLSPSWPAFKSSLTTQFGSICLGSIIVAIFEALRAIISSLDNDKCRCIGCLIRCCLNCIAWAINYFNKYAFCMCAIYGTSFTKSSSLTWQLFNDRGIMALINDDLSGSVLFCGSLLSGIVTGLIGYGIGWIFYDKYSDNTPINLAIFGGFVGLILCASVLCIISSGIVSIFVLFAEDPASMKKNHPIEFDTLVESHPNFNNISDNVPTYDYDDYQDNDDNDGNNDNDEIDLVQV